MLVLCGRLRVLYQTPNGLTNEGIPMRTVEKKAATLGTCLMNLWFCMGLAIQKLGFLNRVPKC